MDKTDPITRLKAWSKLQGMRDHDIRTARNNGYTYTQLTNITGLSRQQLMRITRAKN